MMIDDIFKFLQQHPVLMEITGFLLCGILPILVWIYARKIIKYQPTGDSPLLDKTMRYVIKPLAWFIIVPLGLWVGFLITRIACVKGTGILGD